MIYGTIVQAIVLRDLLHNGQTSEGKRAEPRRYPRYSSRDGKRRGKTRQGICRPSEEILRLIA